MKWVMVIGLLSWHIFSAVGQDNQVEVSIGYNRVGLYVNPSYGLFFGPHIVNVGPKIYGYNLFFEGNPIGASARYGLRALSQSEKFYFGPTIGISGFQERKTATRLWLGELIVGNDIGFQINNRWSINQSIGLGVIAARSELPANGSTSTNYYINYEARLGMVYHFGTDRLSKTE